jgi:hypothetical protein
MRYPFCLIFIFLDTKYIKYTSPENERREIILVIICKYKGVVILVSEADSTDSEKSTFEKLIFREIFEISRELGIFSCRVAL